MRYGWKFENARRDLRGLKPSGFGLKPSDDQNGVDPEHPEGIVEDIVDATELLGLVDDQAVKGTGWVQIVHIYRSMANPVLKTG